MKKTHKKDVDYRIVKHAARVLYADTVFTANSDRAYNAVQHYLTKKVSEGIITVTDRCHIMHDILRYWNEQDLIAAGEKAVDD